MTKQSASTEFANFATTLFNDGRSNSILHEGTASQMRNWKSKYSLLIDMLYLKLTAAGGNASISQSAKTAKSLTRDDRWEWDARRQAPVTKEELTSSRRKVKRTKRTVGMLLRIIHIFYLQVGIDPYVYSRTRSILRRSNQG